MTRVSLKEQLQALTTTEAKPVEHSKTRVTPKKNVPTTRNEKKDKFKPAWLEYAQYGVELLKAHFPHCFKSLNEIKPLKVGIKQDLVKLLGTKEDIVIGDKACMVSSLSYYVNSPAYHKAVVAGAARIDLNGEPAGVVTEEEANYSKEHKKNKAAKNSKDKTPVAQTTEALE